MPETDFDPAAIAADAVALAELHGGTGHERVRTDWLQRRLRQAPGIRSVDEVGNLVWTFGPPPYRLAVLVHVDDVFDETTPRGVTQRDGWLCGPGIGDNAIAVATTVAVAELSRSESWPVAVVFTVGEEGLGGLRGAHHACRELAPEAVLALEGHGCDRVFTGAVGSLRVRFTVTGPGGHSWWDRGRPSAVHTPAGRRGPARPPFDRPAGDNRGRLDRRERGAGRRDTGGRSRLLRGRGHARPDRTDPRRLHRHRCRATARRPGRGSGTHPGLI
jgi:hypothetical protein